VKLQLCSKEGAPTCAAARADHGGGAALLQTALRLVVGVALRDAAARGPEFNGRPFFRVFIGLFSELPAGPGAADAAELPYLARARAGACRWAWRGCLVSAVLPEWRRTC